MPSLEEGLPLVLGQAMACGTPVIASEATGAADLFTDGREGFIVPCRDPAAIREKIEWMMINPASRDEMSIAALSLIRSLQGWGQYTKTAIGIYSSVLHAH